jgi:dsDNA-binding SOS-regulon protein
MATSEAMLRTIKAEGDTYVAMLDVAALLLDIADTVDSAPGITAADTLRSLAAGLTGYGA